MAQGPTRFLVFGSTAAAIGPGARVHRAWRLGNNLGGREEREGEVAMRLENEQQRQQGCGKSGSLSPNCTPTCNGWYLGSVVGWGRVIANITSSAQKATLSRP